MDAHAARVALLAEDMFDADPNMLARAIDQHVARSPYFPKASDLRQLMADITDRRGFGAPVNLAERYNQRLAHEGSVLRWRYRDPSNLESELILESTVKTVAPMDLPRP